MKDKINFTDKYVCLIDMHNARRHFTKNFFYIIDHKYYNQSNSLSGVSLIDDNKGSILMSISEFFKNFMLITKLRKLKLKKLNELK
jgi:hypothetical protein